MTSFARFYNLHLSLYDVIGDVTNQLKKSEIIFLLKQWCLRLPKYSIPIQFNVKNKQETQISAKHALSRCCCHGNIRSHNQNSTTSPNCQINLRKIPMIWKDCLKLWAIQSWRGHQPPPPPPPLSRRNRVKYIQALVRTRTGPRTRTGTRTNTLAGNDSRW